MHYNYILGETISYATYEVTVSKTIHNTDITYLDYQLNFCDLWYYMYSHHCPIKRGHYKYLYNSTFFPAIFTEV